VAEPQTNMRQCTKILSRTSVLAGVLVVLVAGLIVSTTALAQALEIIELRHRLADDVIPVIQPLVEPGGVLTGRSRRSGGVRPQPGEATAAPSACSCQFGVTVMRIRALIPLRT